MRNRLVELRKRDGLTQDQLGALVAVSRQTVNSIERGRYDPSLPLAIRIARLFKLPVEEVFQLDDEHADAPAQQ